MRLAVEIGLGADGPYPTRICVDDAASNSDARRETQISGSLLGQRADQLTCALIVSILEGVSALVQRGFWEGVPPR